RAVGVLDLELVVEREARLREERFPQPRGILELRLDPGRLDADADRLGPVRANDDAVVRLVGAEHAVRIRTELDAHSTPALVCSRRSIPVTGTLIHSGRLSSS